MDDLVREINNLKLNQTKILANQSRILTHLNLNECAVVSPQPSLPNGEVAQEAPPSKKRRRTVSKKYAKDPQKLITYGGLKIHLQVFYFNFTQVFFK